MSRAFRLGMYLVGILTFRERLKFGLDFVIIDRVVAVLSGVNNNRAFFFSIRPASVDILRTVSVLG